MPSTSAKQAKFMRAIAHSPSFAKKVGVKQSVGKDFEMADKKTKKFGDGGTSGSGYTFKQVQSELDAMGKRQQAAKAAKAAKSKATSGEPDMGREPTDADIAKMNQRPKGNFKFSNSAKGGKVKKYAAGGGVTKQLPTATEMGSMNMAKGGSADKAGRALVRKSADTKGRAMKMNKGGKCYAKGGSIDGIATKGKTRCKGAK